MAGKADVSSAVKPAGFKAPGTQKGPAMPVGKATAVGPHKAAPLHDPKAEDALVLNAAECRSGTIVPVVVDPCAHDSNISLN